MTPSWERYELPDFILQLRTVKYSENSNAVVLDIDELRPKGFHFGSKHYWGERMEYMTRVYKNKENHVMTEIYKRRD